MSDVPRFSSPEEADAWMAEHETLLWRREQISKGHFKLYRPEDGCTVGYARTRLDNGKFAVFAVDDFDPHAKPPVLWREYRLRRDAKSAAIKEFRKRSPKWSAKNPAPVTGEK